MSRPVLALTTTGNAAHFIEASQDAIPTEVWHEISLVLGDEIPARNTSLRIRRERLIKEAGVLQGLLRRRGISLTVDDRVRDILQRVLADQKALKDALAASPLGARKESLPDLGERQLIRELRPFQQRDLVHLLNLRHGANFSVPGAGKTTVTLVLHAAARVTEGIDRLLVVAPLSAFNAWEEDAEAVLRPGFTICRWRNGPIPLADIILINYERLPNRIPEIVSWMARHRVHLVADEAHRAKRGAAGGRGRALLELAPLAIRRDILTGTPAPNQPKDLVALLDVLWPDGRASKVLPKRALQADPPVAIMRVVNESIRALFVRTTKSELDLPRMKIRAVRVEMEPLQKEIYNAMLNRYSNLFDLDRRDAAMFAQMGEVMMYLLQAASSPKLLGSTANSGTAYRFPPLAVPEGSRLAQLVENFADHEVPAKIAAACTIIRENSLANKKTLVWSNFPENLLDLEQQLRGLCPAVIYGAVPVNEDLDSTIRTREREITRFKTDDSCKVLLANPAALSEGVSLHKECHDAIYIDRTFNAGQYLQSLDRIHRLGLPATTETNITLLIAKGTIDERVATRIAQKTERLGYILNDHLLTQMALPDEEDIGLAVDGDEDIDAILAHLQEGVSLVCE